MMDFLRIALGFMVLFSLIVAESANGSPRIQIDKPFPGLVLPSLKDGSPLSLTDFRGGKTILHVFASW